MSCIDASIRRGQLVKKGPRRQQRWRLDKIDGAVLPAENQYVFLLIFKQAEALKFHGRFSR